MESLQCIGDYEKKLKNREEKVGKIVESMSYHRVPCTSVERLYTESYLKILVYKQTFHNQCVSTRIF